MGNPPATRQGPDRGTLPHPPAEGPVAAFDFDGTLTWKDSFRAFLAWRSGSLRHAVDLVRMAPAALAYAADRDRAALKSAMARVCLAGADLSDLERQARQFAASAMGWLLRPDAVACWDDWRAQGARVVIVTASPEFVVAPFAELLGAERILGTRLATDSSGRLTGALDGTNCRGPEKVSRLRAAFGPDVRVAAAYGDSDGDEAMLAIAEVQGMKVFRGRR